MKKMFSLFFRGWILCFFAIFSFSISYNNFSENFSTNSVYAADEKANIGMSEAERAKAAKFRLQAKPDESINLTWVETDGNPVLSFLKIIRDILLKLVLPVVAVGCGLYIAYNLLTAEGDESKMASTWKAILYSVIAIITIGLSALIVDVISRLSIG